MADSIRSKSRQLALNACNACRQRKTKCDEAKPQCSRCSRLELTCTYVETVASRKDLSLNELNGTLQRLEDKLDTLLESNSSKKQHDLLRVSHNDQVMADSPAAASVSEARGSSLHGSLNRILATERHSTAPQHLLSWPCSPVQLTPAELQYPVALEIRQTRLPDTIEPPSCLTIADSGGSHWLTQLSLSQFRFLAQLYFSHFHPSYMILDEAHFYRHSFNQVLQNDFGEGIDTCLVLLVLGLGSVAAYHMGHDEWSPADSESPIDEVGLGFFNIAKNMFRRIGSVDWPSVQCLLLMAQILAEFDFPASRLSEWASDVPLPVVLDTGTQPQYREYQFSMLAVISLRRLLNRIHSYLYSAESVHGFATAFGRRHEVSSPTGDNENFPNSISSPQAENMVAPPESLISELDRQLEEWRACLPTTLQFPPFALSHSEQLATHGFQSPIERLKDNLMARYFAAKSILHRPFLYRLLHNRNRSQLSQRDLTGAKIAIKSAFQSFLHNRITHESLYVLVHPINTWRSLFALELQIQFILRAGESCHFALPENWRIVMEVREQIAETASAMSPCVARDSDILQMF